MKKDYNLSNPNDMRRFEKDLKKIGESIPKSINKGIRKTKVKVPINATNSNNNYFNNCKNVAMGDSVIQNCISKPDQSRFKDMILGIYNWFRSCFFS